MVFRGQVPDKVSLANQFDSEYDFDEDNRQKDDQCGSGYEAHRHPRERLIILGSAACLFVVARKKQSERGQMSWTGSVQLRSQVWMTYQWNHKRFRSCASSTYLRTSICVVSHRSIPNNELSRSSWFLHPLGGKQ